MFNNYFIQPQSEPFIEIQHEVFASRGDSEKNPSSSLRDLVGRSNH